MTGVHVIKKDPEGGTGTLYWRETSVDTALFPLGKIDGPCKQINYAESIANTCRFQFNANLFLTLPLRRLGCMPGSECMFRLLQGRKGALYMLHRGSCPQDYWFPTRGFTELHSSVHHSESQVCFFFFFFIHLFEDIQYPEPWNKIAVSVLDGSGLPDTFAQNMRFLLGLLILIETQATSSPGCLSYSLKSELILPLLPFPTAANLYSRLLLPAYLSLDLCRLCGL